jgi:hypothetical protein
LILERGITRTHNTQHPIVGLTESRLPT